jgi:hypothetical protein
VYGSDDLKIYILIRSYFPLSQKGYFIPENSHSTYITENDYSIPENDYIIPENDYSIPENGYSIPENKNSIPGNSYCCTWALVTFKSRSWINFNVNNTAEITIISSISLGFINALNCYKLISRFHAYVLSGHILG